MAAQLQSFFNCIASGNSIRHAASAIFQLRSQANFARPPHPQVFLSCVASGQKLVAQLRTIFSCVAAGNCWPHNFREILTANFQATCGRTASSNFSCVASGTFWQCNFMQFPAAPRPANVCRATSGDYVAAPNQRTDNIRSLHPTCL